MSLPTMKKGSGTGESSTGSASKSSHSSAMHRDLVDNKARLQMTLSRRSGLLSVTIAFCWKLSRLLRR